MTYKKKLIEVAIPLEAINTASEAEKSNPFLSGHPRSLHQWWARRPIPAARAILFAQLVDDPSSSPERFPSEAEVQSERARLFRLMEDLVKWEHMTNETVLQAALVEIRNSNKELPAIYDPFSGGGIIPSEAQRLGLESIGSDINPIAMTIGKAMIEFPYIFKGSRPANPTSKNLSGYRNCDGLVEDIKYYARRVRENALSKISEFYPRVGSGKEQNVLAWIWTRTVPSPDPAFNSKNVPIASTFVLANKKGREAWVLATANKSDGCISYEVKRGKYPDRARFGTKHSSGANFTCMLSGAAITAAYIREQAQKGKLGAQLIAVVARIEGKKTYLSPIDEHQAIADNVPDVTDISLKFDKDALGFRVGNYGMEDFSDLYTARQRLALGALSESVLEIASEIEQDAQNIFPIRDETPLSDGGVGHKAYSQALSVYLQFVVDKLSGYLNSLSVWNNTNENVSNLFGRQTIQMTWDFAETNPFGPLLDYAKVAESVANALTNIRANAPGLVFQSPAQYAVLHRDNIVISTDPPYYDNVGYADLSDFFYMWMRQSLKDILPGEFGTIATPKADELVASPHRYGGKKGAEQFFIEGMTSALQNIMKLDSGLAPATIYYAFKQSEIEADGLLSAGWAAFLEAILKAGYLITSTWPVRTERAARLRAHGSNALGSSVVLVCRKRPVEAEVVTRAEFLRELKRELRISVNNLQLANIPPADMPQSAIGPGMGVFSRYKSVLESDDSPMSVKAALQLINHELDEYLTGIQGEFDADTRLAITWFEQFGLGTGPYGTADNIARGRGIAVESAKHAGILDSSAGKVRILKRDELPENWNPTEDKHLTVWECCQQVVRALENGGEFEAAVLIRAIGPAMAENVKDLAYVLYNICEKRKDAKEATSYNALIAVWSDLTRLAASSETANRGGQYSLAV